MNSIMSSDTVTGEDASSKNVSVSSESTSHTCHADFLPLPEKNEITSHPVKAWKNNNDLDLCSPSASAIWCAAIYL